MDYLYPLIAGEFMSWERRSDGEVEDMVVEWESTVREDLDLASQLKWDGTKKKSSIWWSYVAK